MTHPNFDLRMLRTHNKLTLHGPVTDPAPLENAVWKELVAGGQRKGARGEARRLVKHASFPHPRPKERRRAPKPGHRKTYFRFDGEKVVIDRMRSREATAKGYHNNPTRAVMEYRGPVPGSLDLWEVAEKLANPANPVARLYCHLRSLWR